LVLWRHRLVNSRPVIICSQAKQQTRPPLQAQLRPSGHEHRKQQLLTCPTTSVGRVTTFNKRVCAYNYFSRGRGALPRRPGRRPHAGGRFGHAAGGRFVLSGPLGVPARVRACMRGTPAKNPVSVCGRRLPPPIDPGIHPNRPRKQETKYERNNLAARRSVLTWCSSSQYPNYASDFRPCRTSTPVPVTYYRSYPPAFHSLLVDPIQRCFIRRGHVFLRRQM
jgi:hypothetical protein